GVVSLHFSSEEGAESKAILWFDFIEIHLFLKGIARHVFMLMWGKGCPATVPDHDLGQPQRFAGGILMKDRAVMASMISLSPDPENVFVPTNCVGIAPPRRLGGTDSDL